MVQDWPPLKSMPWFRPRVAREMHPARMMMAEMANHHFRLPMKSNEVSPRYSRSKTLGRFCPPAASVPPE